MRPPADRSALGRLGLLILLAGCALRARPPTPATGVFPGVGRTPAAEVTVFRHPGLLSSADDLAFVRARLAAGAEPWRTAFERLAGSEVARLDRRPAPRPVVDCGPYSRPDHGCSEEKADAQAAYAQALLWTLGGGRAHAAKAIEVLDAWSSVLRAHAGHNAPLQSAWAASVFVRAAELVAHGDAGWSPDGQRRFARLLREVYLPAVAGGSPTFNGNWELSMIEAAAGIAVFLDDAPLFARALAAWRARVPSYFYEASDGPLPRRPPGTDRFAD